jgi:hypothetical protein
MLEKKKHFCRGTIPHLERRSEILCSVLLIKDNAFCLGLEKTKKTKQNRCCPLFDQEIPYHPIVLDLSLRVVEIKNEFKK